MTEGWSGAIGVLDKCSQIVITLYAFTKEDMANNLDGSIEFISLIFLYVFSC